MPVSTEGRRASAAAALLACACSGGGGPGREAWLIEVTQDAGLDFVHEAGARGALLLPEITGGGVALFDCDGDGDLDVLLINGGPDSAAPRAGRGPPPIAPGEPSKDQRRSAGWFG